MSKDTFTPNEHDEMFAVTGVMNQVEWHGLLELYNENENFKKFVERMIKNAATNIAAVRYYSNALNNAILPRTGEL